MADGLTYKEIAKRLGMSRTMVMLIEARAIAKLRAQLDFEPKEKPSWKTKGYKGGEAKRKCSVCGCYGHNAQTCQNPPPPP